MEAKSLRPGAHSGLLSHLGCRGHSRTKLGSAHSKARLLPSLWRGKRSVYRGCQVRSPGSSCSEDLDSLGASRDRLLETGWGRGLGVWSAHRPSSDWLVVRSPGVTIVNLLASPGLGSTAGGQHAVSSSHLVGASASAKQLPGHGSEHYL